MLMGWESPRRLVEFVGVIALALVVAAAFVGLLAWTIDTWGAGAWRWPRLT